MDVNCQNVRPLGRRVFWAMAFATVLTVMGCGDEKRLVHLQTDGFRQDVFVQEAASKLDLLWVIDNSESMAPHQVRLAQGLNRFMAFLDRGGVDYRLATTSTDARRDAGVFLGSPSIVSPTLADPAAAFARNIRLGTSGSGHEEAFEAARLAIGREAKNAANVLEKKRACEADCGASSSCLTRCDETFVPNFMRQSAHLHVIFVSDEEEQSTGEVRYFQRQFETALGLGNEDAVRVATICGLSESDRCAKSRGNRYLQLAQGMSGVTASICDDDFEKSLESIAMDAAGLKRRFALSNQALPETVTVQVAYRCDVQGSDMGTCDERTDNCEDKPGSFYGVLCIPPKNGENGWSFESRSNALLFHGPALPGIRSKIYVSYTADPDALSSR